MKYIFIIYLFDMLDANILLYQFDQIETHLTQNKIKYILYFRTQGVTISWWIQIDDNSERGLYI